MQRSYYRKEMILVILVKLVALGILWYVCFSHPLDKHLSITALSGHWLGTDREGVLQTVSA
ncbi:MAG: hypothetical protein A3E85_00830 [Gammaproteobacteria bacterium RIFCSPHIGHO2_12_FULL_45_12]|nr:MAG: hypothetical protein A3E85_00830 [Gammaproteobacteria bacterium RIFCSPHIGHO2_12_FULL_45_12]